MQPEKYCHALVTYMMWQNTVTVCTIQSKVARWTVDPTGRHWEHRREASSSCSRLWGCNWHYYYPCWVQVWPCLGTVFPIRCVIKDSPRWGKKKPMKGFSGFHFRFPLRCCEKQEVGQAWVLRGEIRKNCVPEQLSKSTYKCNNQHSEPLFRWVNFMTFYVFPLY